MSGTAGAESRPLPVRVARSLESARPGEILLVDQRGDLVQPQRHRAMQAAAAGGLTAAYAAGGLLLAGPVGAAVGAGAAILGLRLRALRRPHAIQRALALSSAGRHQDAERLLRRIEHRRGLFPSARASIEFQFARLAWRRGDLAGAEKRIDAALAVCRRAPRSLEVYRCLLELLRVELLAVTGRVGAAERARSGLDRIPGGDVFELYRRSADLSVAFARGTTDELPEDLHEWIRQALSMNTSGPMLVALAWAEHARGDRDMAEHLLAEAPSRMAGVQLRLVHPDLGDWYDERRAAWGLDQADPEESPST